VQLCRWQAAAIDHAEAHEAVTEPARLDLLLELENMVLEVRVAAGAQGGSAFGRSPMSAVAAPSKFHHDFFGRGAQELGNVRPTAHVQT